MGRPREHDAATAVALLDAAEELLAASGPGAVTVRAVAEARGTTTRAVYSLFGGKAGLLEQLAGRGYDVLTELVDSLSESDDPAADLVAAGVHGFRVFASERPHLFRLTFEHVTAETVQDSVGRRRAGASYVALVRWVARAQAGGVVDDRPEAAVAFEFHATCVGLAITALSRPLPPDGPGFWPDLQPWSDEDLWHAALTALVRGMAPA